MRVSKDIARLVELRTQELDKSALADSLNAEHRRYNRAKRTVLDSRVCERYSWDSFDSFLATVKEGEIAKGKKFDKLGYDPYGEESRVYKDGWTRSMNIDIRGRAHQLDVVKRGFTTQNILDYYNNLKSRLESNPEALSTLGSLGVDCRRKRRADLAGYIVNIDKAMAGIDPMESMKRNNQSMTVRFFIDLARTYGEDPETVLESSCVAIAVAKQLESRGYSTEIKFGTTNWYDERKMLSSINFIGKRPDERINETKLLTMSSVGIFRDFIFSFRRYCQGFNAGMGQSFYTVAPPEHNEEFFKKLTDSDVYVGYNGNLDTVVTGVSGVLND